VLPEVIGRRLNSPPTSAISKRESISNFPLFSKNTTGEEEVSSITKD
jgi:hypothetical protein